MAIKVGTEDKKKVAIAAALGLVALLLAAWTLFSGPDTPAVAPSQSVPVSSSPTPSASSGTSSSGLTNTAGSTGRTTSVATLDPTLHPDFIA